MYAPRKELEVDLLDSKATLEQNKQHNTVCKMCHVTTIIESKKVKFV